MRDDEEKQSLNLDFNTTGERKTTNINTYYWKYARAHACEFITSMILLFNVCSAGNTIVITASDNSTMSFSTPLIPALTAGMTIFAVLTMFFYVSVAHVSPVVTFGFAMGGSFDWKLVPSYIICQILGSTVGATIAMYTVGDGSVVGAVELPAEISQSEITGIFIAEMQVCFILVLATNLVIGNPKWELPTATFMIGMCVFTGIMAGDPAGAGQMNPAKVMATAILSGNFNHHWVWWISGLMGSAQAALIFRIFFAENNNLIHVALNKDE